MCYECDPVTGSKQTAAARSLTLTDVVASQGDLEDMKTVSDIANKVKGKVDILVNNAGMLNKESILEGTVPLRAAQSGQVPHASQDSCLYCQNPVY